MQKLGQEKGITLIALIITIIVMLILVGVSVTVALNGGLFTTAKEAAEGTASKRNEELELSSGKVEINGEWYNSIDEYVNGGSSNEPTQPENPTGYTAYVVGNAVTVNGEDFYVLKDSGSSESTVTLLAKDCIVVDESSEDYLKQSASADLPAFSSRNYWSSETEYPFNLNDYEIPEGVTAIPLTIAKTYGTNLGGTGRLMTKEEADALNTDAYSDILYGTNGKSSSSSLAYWLGSAYDVTDPWAVYGVNRLLTSGYCTYDDECGVRPVVEISKSNIS